LVVPLLAILPTNAPAAAELGMSQTARHFLQRNAAMIHYVIAKPPGAGRPPVTMTTQQHRRVVKTPHHPGHLTQILLVGAISNVDGTFRHAYLTNCKLERQALPNSV
jgi:hypothetical protein